MHRVIDNYYKETSRVGGFLLNQLNKIVTKGGPRWANIKGEGFSPN